MKRLKRWFCMSQPKRCPGCKSVLKSMHNFLYCAKCNADIYYPYESPFVCKYCGASMHRAPFSKCSNCTIDVESHGEWTGTGWNAVLHLARRLYELENNERAMRRLLKLLGINHVFLSRKPARRKSK